MGEEFLEYAIEPFVSGNYAGDVERLGIQSTFPRLFDLEQRYGSLTLGAVIQRLRGSRTNCQRRLFSFKDGMEALPGAISRFLGNRLLKGHQVIGLEPRNKGWEVTAIGPSKEVRRFTSDAVALSAPAESAANLTASLSGTLKGLLAGIEYSPVVVLYLGFARNQVRHPLDGMGYLVPRKEKGFVLGSLWSSTLFPNRAPAGKVALTNYLGGSRWPGVLGMDDGILLNKTLGDLKKTLGIAGDPEFVRIIRHPTALPQYSLDHQERLRKIDESLRKHPGLFLAGNYLRGISVRDCISQGMRISGQVLEYLTRQKS
ncbi:MAG: protoporphyrinogen oxidase, partial [Nitrospirae bacterium]|nr:protoporphyrinogen oxidase [Nitrospirota bacterium]